MMVAYQVLTIADVANGLLMYVAQAFLLAGSIFGLDYYIKKIKDDFQSWELRVYSFFQSGVQTLGESGQAEREAVL